MKYVARFIGPANLDMARQNLQVIGNICAGVLRTQNTEHLARIASQCRESIRARNSTKPTKVAGKTSLATLILLCARPQEQLVLTGLVSTSDSLLQQLYADIIAGKNLPEVPAWAKDKHTTYVPQGTSIFVRVERAGLAPVHDVPDPYYDRVVLLAAERDAKEAAERQQKRKKPAAENASKKQRGS
jgi:hypothetical protein